MLLGSPFLVGKMKRSELYKESVTSSGQNFHKDDFTRASGWHLQLHFMTKVTLGPRPFPRIVLSDNRDLPSPLTFHPPQL